MNQIFKLLLVIVISASLVNCSIKGAPKDGAQTSASQAPQCLAGEILYQNQCLAQYMPCAMGGGSGSQEFLNGTYGACRISSCPAATHLENSVCVSNNKACAIANGNGQQTWNGGGYGVCTLATCNAEYRVSGNSCIGPVVTLYRYSKPENGLTAYYWANVNNAPATGYTLQGLAFILYKNSSAEAPTPLLLCDLKRDQTISYYYAATDCATFGGVSTVLGYMPNAPLANGANKPIHYCQYSAGSFGNTTTNAAECAGAVIGYSF